MSTIGCNDSSQTLLRFSSANTDQVSGLTRGHLSGLTVNLRSKVTLAQSCQYKKCIALHKHLTLHAFIAIKVLNLLEVGIKMGGTTMLIHIKVYVALFSCYMYIIPGDNLSSCRRR